MRYKYASIPSWLNKFFKIDRLMDNTCFKMHDHDYGTAGYTTNNWARAKTRKEADVNLRNRLIQYGMPKYKAYVLWVGCVLLLSNKWRK